MPHIKNVGVASRLSRADLGKIGGLRWWKRDGEFIFLRSHQCTMAMPNTITQEPLLESTQPVRRLP
jgi:hypothetical protein